MILFVVVFIPNKYEGISGKSNSFNILFKGSNPGKSHESRSLFKQFGEIKIKKIT